MLLGLQDMNWPNKNKREQFEISGFVKAYARLPEARQFEIVTKSEAPDYILRDAATDKEFGVELTSVYIDDRSVPDFHKKEGKGIIFVPHDEGMLERYTQRLIEAIVDKISKARKHYSTKRPLILAVYINEYISIYLGRDELESFVHRYKGVFDSVAPFVEVVFWNLNNEGVFRVRPESTS